MTECPLVWDILKTLVHWVFRHVPCIKLTSKVFAAYFEMKDTHANLLVDYTKWERYIKDFKLVPCEESKRLISSYKCTTSYKKLMEQWKVLCNWPEYPPAAPSIINANSHRLFELFKYLQENNNRFLIYQTDLNDYLWKKFGDGTRRMSTERHTAREKVLLAMSRFPFAELRPTLRGSLLITSDLPRHNSFKYHFSLVQYDTTLIFTTDYGLKIELEEFSAIGDDAYGNSVAYTDDFGIEPIRELVKIQGQGFDLNRQADTMLSYCAKGFLFHVFCGLFIANSYRYEATRRIDNYLLEKGAIAAKESFETCILGPYTGRIPVQ